MLTSNPKYFNRYFGNSDQQTDYELNSGYYGNAMYETSSQGTSNYSWNLDYSFFYSLNSPFSVRGANDSYRTSAGGFNFTNSTGGIELRHSWRVTAVVQLGM